MRKILTQEQKDKRIKRNQLIIGSILIGVMIFGTLGYAFSGRENENSEKIDYNGITFVKNDYYWMFNLQGYEFITMYNPIEVENITFLSYSSINNYAGKPLYMVSDFNEPNYEISRNLNPFVSRINGACLSEDCDNDFSIKNCSIDNIIIIQEPEKEGTKESIYQQENCIFITSSIENQTRYVDAFLFKVLGI